MSSNFRYFKNNMVYIDFKNVEAISVSQSLYKYNYMVLFKSGGDIKVEQCDGILSQFNKYLELRSSEGRNDHEQNK